MFVFTVQLAAILGIIKLAQIVQGEKFKEDGKIIKHFVKARNSQQWFAWLVMIDIFYMKTLMFCLLQLYHLHLRNIPMIISSIISVFLLVIFICYPFFLYKVVLKDAKTKLKDKVFRRMYGKVF